MIDIIEFVEESLGAMLNSGEVECPSDNCDNRRFSVNIWWNDERGLVGDASCRDCDLRIELDLADEPIDTAKSAIDELEAVLHSRSSVDRGEMETAE